MAIPVCHAHPVHLHQHVVRKVEDGVRVQEAGQPFTMRRDVAVADDRDDVVAEQAVVAEPQAAEVPDPQTHREQQRHVDAWDYAVVFRRARVGDCGHVPPRT